MTSCVNRGWLFFLAFFLAFLLQKGGVDGLFSEESMELRLYHTLFNSVL